MLERFVAGTPAPQGSKRFLGVRGGHAVLVESSRALGSWRADVRAAFTGAGTIAGPVVVEVVFRLPRPASVSVKRRPLPTVRPDVDKLCRAVLDALTSAGVYGDDAQVVRLVASKEYVTPGLQGALVRVSGV
jgi:Holliday junction resolvase RusA-like endonuclease